MIMDNPEVYINLKRFHLKHWIQIKMIINFMSIYLFQIKRKKSKEKNCDSELRKATYNG